MQILHFAKTPLAGLLSKGYAAERRKLIDPDRAAKTSRGRQSAKWSRRAPAPLWDFGPRAGRLQFAYR